MAQFEWKSEKPMWFNGYRIQWNDEKGTFEVFNNTDTVQFSHTVGPECYNWCGEQERGQENPHNA